MESEYIAFNTTVVGSALGPACETLASKLGLPKTSVIGWKRQKEDGSRIRVKLPTGVEATHIPSTEWTDLVREHPRPSITFFSDDTGTKLFAPSGDGAMRICELPFETKTRRDRDIRTGEPVEIVKLRSIRDSEAWSADAAPSDVVTQTYTTDKGTDAKYRIINLGPDAKSYGPHVI